MSSCVTVTDIAAHVGGRVVGDGDRRISGVNVPEVAQLEDLVFADSPKGTSALRHSSAGAALVQPATPVPNGMSAILVDDPLASMIRAVELLVPTRRTFEDVSPHAVLGRDVDLGQAVGVGPFVYIGDDAAIGQGTEIHPGATVGSRVRIGRDCVIHSGVHLYHDVVIGNRVVLHSGTVIGADGFGYVREPLGDAQLADDAAHHRKIPQVGTVVVEDDVEVGANTTIDRAALHVTTVGRGTKIDNLVTIGHNATLGRHCLIVAQAGVSGSTELEDYVTVAGQAGLIGHLRIGRGAVIGSQAGVTKNVPPGRSVLGSPALEVSRSRKALAVLPRLPVLRRTVADHEQRLARIEREQSRS